MDEAQIMGRIVAPFAGAWIEITMQLHLLRKQLASLPSRERGLKFYRWWTVKPEFASLPSRERGLKSRSVKEVKMAVKSLPSRERGLKFDTIVTVTDVFCRSLRGSVD